MIKTHRETFFKKLLNKKSKNYIDVKNKKQ